jgi:type 1 glutamine amidotransferase
MTSKIKILILNGNCSHGWPELTQAVQEILLTTGKFEVDVSTSPPQKSSDEEWAQWSPRFTDYQVVINTYEGREFAEDTRNNFEQFVASGNGAMVLHSSVAVFENWRAYLDMIGLGWRNAWAGDHIFVEENGEVIRTPPFHGVGPGHGKQHTYQVRNRQPDHPIMKDIPELWMHGKDELYHGMRGPANNLTVLATAYSAKEQWGSGDSEPMLWTVPYGEGRVVTTVLGHRWYDDRIEGHPVEAENGVDAVHCLGFQTLIARSVEWAATGQVTLPVPATFPAATETCIMNPDQVKWV